MRVHSDYEADSFEAFIRFYEPQIRMIAEGTHNAVRDFTGSFRRSIVGHGVVTYHRGKPWTLTPRAVEALAAIGGG